MSTNVNITIDGGDLSGDIIQRAQMEQAAHRQSQQIDRSRKRAGEKGRIERNRRLDSQGVDSGKSLIPTAPFTPPRQRRKLTANDSGVPGVLLVPDNGYSNYGGTLSGIRGRSQESKPIFARLSLSTRTFVNETGILPVFSWGRNFPEFTYLPSGGPNGKGALEITINNPNTGTVRIHPFVAEPGFPPPGELLYYYTSFDFLPDIDPANRYNEFEPIFSKTSLVSSAQGLVYALTKNRYDTLPDWQGSALSTALPPYRLLKLDNDLDLDNDLVPAKPKYKWVDAPNFTQEFFVRCGSGNLEPGRPYRTIGNNDPGFAPDMRGGKVILGFAGVHIEFAYAENLIIANPEVAAWVAVDNTVLTSTGALIIRLRDYIFPVKLNTSIQLHCSTSLTRTTTGNPSSRPPASHFLVNDQEWVHVAVVKRRVSGQSRWSVYYNGKNIFPDETITEQPGWADTYGQQPISTRIDAHCWNGPWSPPEPQRLAIHGYRFTPRARYKEDFTPPTSITSL